jgi:hypothetical protein
VKKSILKCLLLKDSNHHQRIQPNVANSNATFTPTAPILFIIRNPSCQAPDAQNLDNSTPPPDYSECVFPNFGSNMQELNVSPI